MVRFFLKNKEIKNKTVMFDEEQSKKIRKVMRMKAGDKVAVFDNNAWTYTVELEKITNNFSVGKIVEQEMVEKSTNIVLYQSLPKNLKTEFIIQKCTELGVDKIVFFASDFSQIKANLVNDSKVKRWRKVAIESTEQCGRNFVPEIQLETGNLEGILKELKDQNNFFLHQDGEYLELQYDKNLASLNFFVGPEGGFSPEEIKNFESYKVKKVKIAENILRSETAGMAFLSQIELLRN